MLNARLVISVLAGVLVLSGCATTKPELPDAQYYGFARAWHTVGWCAHNGWMDPATAASGKTYISTTINGYSYSQDKLAQLDKSPDLTKTISEIKESDCRDAAVSIQARKQQIENQNDTARIQSQNIQNIINATKPTSTYCNKIGTQVFCNSF